MKRVLIDMDGVLACFASEAMRLSGIPDMAINDFAMYPGGEWEIAKVAGITISEFWDRINAKGEDFWTGLKMYEWAIDLIGLIDQMFPDAEVAICTSPSWSPDSHSGKRKWLDDVLGWKRPVIMIREKEWLAGPDVVLIDDSDANCEKFSAAGGKVSLFPQKWNKRYAIKDRLSRVALDLSEMQSHPSAESETILQEAIRITSIDRQSQYGHPKAHLLRTTGAINAIYPELFAKPLEPHHWAAFMRIDKCARHAHGRKRDNLVDMAGYARVEEMLDDID